MKTKMIALLLLLSGSFSATTVFAQPNPDKVIEQMKKFSWMVGDWKGEAWYMGRDQKKTLLTQKEHIVSKLDGTIITMEGTGFDIPANSEEAKVVFSAFGVFTYDQVNSKFVLRAYQGGNFIDSDLEINTDGSYSWGIDSSYGKTRYILRLTEDGKWNEKGEFSPDGGDTWFPIFEMTLTRQK